METFFNLPLHLMWHPDRRLIFEEFVKEISDKYAYEFIGTEDSNTIWSALWVVDGDYLLEEDIVYLMRDKKVVAMTGKFNVDFVTHYYMLNIEDLSTFGNLLEQEDLDIECCRDFRLNLKHINHKATPQTFVTNGQLKLLCNALEVLDKPVGHVVVIGGGGPDYSVSGLTYSALSDTLPNMTFEIYDPLESTYINANRRIISTEFDYETLDVREEVTHVIDDAYYLSPAKVKWDHRVLDFTSSTYCGKFTALVVEGTIHLVESKHGHLVRDNALGGGYIIKDRGKVIVSETSKIGPYDDVAILRSYPQWIVYPPTVFNNKKNYARLKKIFPKAAITIKALLNKIEGANEVIREQHYYKGNEKRIYYKARPLPLVGSECVICHYTRQCSRRLKVSESIIRDLFVRVGCESCQAYKHKTLVFMKHLVYELVRKCPLKNVVVDILTKTTNHTEKAIKAFLGTLENQGKLYIYHSIEGSRYMRTKSVLNRMPLVPDDEKNLLMILSWYFLARCEGEYCFGRGKNRIYIGSDYDIADIVLLKKAPMEVYSKYDKTHDYIKRDYYCLFVRKGFLIRKGFWNELEMFVSYSRGHVLVVEEDYLVIDHKSYPWKTMYSKKLDKSKIPIEACSILRKWCKELGYYSK